MTSLCHCERLKGAKQSFLNVKRIASSSLKNTPPRNDTRGFLLIEVLLTVTILAVSVTVISHALMAVYRNSILAQDYSLALFLLESKMGAVLQKKDFQCFDSETGQFEKPFERFHYTLESSNLKDENASGRL